jgi:hypothetical protein
MEVVMNKLGYRLPESIRPSKEAFQGGLHLLSGDLASDVRKNMFTPLASRLAGECYWKLREFLQRSVSDNAVDGGARNDPE